MTPRIGFCCKYIEYQDLHHPGLPEDQLNQKSTTLTALRKMTRTSQISKLDSLVENNITVLWNQLRYIASLPIERRLFRITSDFFPAFTSEFRPAYDGILNQIEKDLSGVRKFADDNGIRLGTHPGQFTVLSSAKPEVVVNSIVDLEYHALMARMMGYGDTWHSSGFVINVHANNNLDPGLLNFLEIFKTRLSPELRNLLTIENDEYSCSVDQLVSSGIGQHIAFILDIHHHWIASKGEYIQATDPRIQAFKDSWRGQRPLGHFSTSQQGLFEGPVSIGVLPNFKDLLADGHTTTALRKHSNNCWNVPANSWALSHLDWTDLEVEAKAKNWASQTLYLQGVFEGRFKPVESPTLSKIEQLALKV